MGAQMNYFPFHLGDYAAHTAHLEPMEDLAYRRLLDQYYLKEGPLPTDIQATAKLVRMRSMISDVESVLNEFFVLTDAGWTHARCDVEIARMQDKQAKARASAAASVKSRQAFAAKKSQSISTSVEETANVCSTDVENISTNAELPTPTPTPTPTPIKNTKNTAPLCVAPPDGVSISVWRDFEKLRKTKKAPLTETCMAGIRQEAEKAGWPLETVLQECCTRGWQSFKAVWVIERRMSAETFAERDERNAKERYERLTGRKHPDLLPQHLNIIEAEPVTRIAA